MALNKIRHLDLFSGIGGFAYAVDNVWDGAEHIFCDNDKFCQQVLKKHWEGSKIYGDIKEITEPIKADIITGGFPCQPFSHAGQKRGTADDRYLWPEMLRVIQLCKPEWVIAENVSGLVTWSGELVFEQVCTDLEAEGYEVQAFVIPATAVNAPHKRDRVWFIAHSADNGRTHRGALEQARQGEVAKVRSPKTDKPQRQRRKCEFGAFDTFDGWKEIAARVCRDDDGLPNRVDRIKALGNAIVPQAAIQIMQAIRNNHGTE